MCRGAVRILSWVLVGFEKAFCWDICELSFWRFFRLSLEITIFFVLSFGFGFDVTLVHVCLWRKTFLLLFDLGVG